MPYKTWINILVSLVLLVIGTFLADGYTNPLYFYWLIVTALFALAVQFLVVKLNDFENDKKELNNKISLLTVGKKTGGNFSDLQCVCIPRITNMFLEKDSEVTLDVFVSSLMSLEKAPELKLITDSSWTVSINHQVKPANQFAGKYEYLLASPNISNVSNKYFKYSFQVKINKMGENQFSLEINNGEEKIILINSLKVV